MAAPLIIAFSNTLQELYDYVKEVSPHETNSINTLQTFTKALENTGYQIFFEWTWAILGDYQVEILECNESFFLGMEFDNDRDKNYFSRFSSVYKGLPETPRVKLWWYFQQLIKLGQRIEKVQQ